MHPNYWRNSVKVTVDAYTGDATFYIVDEDDPIVKAWDNIFDDLFISGDEMPKEVREHLRYPEELFNVQTAVWATYHMSDPKEFYNKEDRWSFAELDGRLQSALYVLAKLPGAKKAEMLLIRPVTPTDKKNMIAWIAGRMDGDKYGDFVSLRLPSGKTTNGPAQAAGLIDADAEVATFKRDFTNSSSSVVNGELLVLPIKNSLVYVRPFFVVSNDNPLPKLRRVGVVYEDTVGWDTTFDGAMRQVFEKRAAQDAGDDADDSTPANDGGDASDASTPDAAADTADPADGGELPADVDALLVEAGAEFDRAQQCQRDGDWACYGEAIDRVGVLLEQADQLSS